MRRFLRLLALLARAPAPDEGFPVPACFVVGLPVLLLLPASWAHLVLALFGFLLPRWTALRAARYQAASREDEEFRLAWPPWMVDAAVVLLALRWPALPVALLAWSPGPASAYLAAGAAAGVTAGMVLGARSGCVDRAMLRASWWSFAPTVVALLGFLLLLAMELPYAAAAAFLSSPAVTVFLASAVRPPAEPLVVGALLMALGALLPLAWPADCRPAEGGALGALLTTHLCTGLLATFILLGALVPSHVRSGCGGISTACKSNLRNLGTALEMYATDSGGRYPSRADELVPGYLKTIPTCASAGVDTYSEGFVSTPTAYTVVCTGENHRAVDAPPNYPQYNSFRGLVER